MYPKGYNPGDEDMAPDDRCKLMGDMADYVMSNSYDYGEGSDYGDYCYTPKLIKCNKCHSTSVYWHQYDSGKWFLFDNSTKKAHMCRIQDGCN